VTRISEQRTARRDSRRRRRPALPRPAARPPGGGRGARVARPPAADALTRRRQVPDGRGQHDRPGGDGRLRHGRPAALGDRHDGDQRDRLGRGRAARDRADQRRRRHPRAQDQDHPGGRRQRLADVRREGEETAGQRQGRGGLRLLDQRQPQGRAPRLREGERDALLPDVLRGPGGLEERHLHRPGGDPADHLGPELGPQGEGGQDVLPDRLGLHLAAHEQQDRPVPHRALPAGLLRRRRGVLPAGPHELRLADQQGEAEEARVHLLDRGRRVERQLVQAAQGRRHHRRVAREEEPDPADDLDDRGRDPRHRRRERRRVLRLHEVLPEPGQPQQQEVRRRLQGDARVRLGHRRRHAGGLPGAVAVEADGREGRQLRRRQDRRRVRGRRVQGGARGLREDPQEPPPVVQGPHRADEGRRPVHDDRRVPEADRAGPVPQGLSV
ncbi:MAG: Urea ABC transporter, substrate binding protein UrtA, partial [uncultured Phycisphaerae bacterium]